MTEKDASPVTFGGHERRPRFERTYGQTNEKPDNAFLSEFCKTYMLGFRVVIGPTQDDFCLRHFCYTVCPSIRCSDLPRPSPPCRRSLETTCRRSSNNSKPVSQKVTMSSALAAPEAPGVTEDDLRERVALLERMIESLTDANNNVNNNSSSSSNADVEEGEPFVHSGTGGENHGRPGHDGLDGNFDDEMEKDNDGNNSDDGASNDGVLEENSFSFLISSKIGSVPSITAVLVFIVKNSIFSLTMGNIMNFNKIFNKMNVPVSVAQNVTISQLLALLISVFTQNDLIGALILSFSGYSPDMQRAFRHGGGGFRFQYHLAIVLSFIDGFFGLFVTFLMITTSTTVLDVVLNFAVVEFVSGLDEAAFFLAKVGLLGDRNKQEAVHVQEGEFQLKRGTPRSSGFIRTIGLLIILAGVLAGWLYLLLLQARGRYAVSHFMVQFDDNVRRELSAHSGIYTLQAEFNFDPNLRFRYVEERAGGGQFKYCRSERKWVFFLEGNDPCDKNKILVKSIRTGILDLDLLTGEDWFVVLPDKGTQTQPMADFLLQPVCKRDTDCGGPGRGRCDRFRCVCEEGFFGETCVHAEAEVCPRLEVDPRSSATFPAVRQIAATFDRIEGIYVYDKPAYVNKASGDLVIYTGMRWAVTSLKFGFNMTLDEFVPFASSKDFNADTIKKLDMVSDAVMFRSPDDRFSSPFNLKWEIVTNQENLSNTLVATPTVPVFLLCAKCDGGNNCFNDGECVAGGAFDSCNCKHGATGTLCQLPPTSDGNCDKFFNTAEFDYDGGDCCEATCVSSLTQNCGELPGTEDTLAGTIGFPFCKDPSIVGDCQDATLPCYIPNSDPIRSSAFDDSIVALSGSGMTMVVAEPIVSTIRVFDQIDAQWVQRGPDILDGLLNGAVLAIASLDGAISDTVVGYPLTYIAAYDVNDGKIRVYGWATNQWTVEGTFDTLQDPSVELFDVQLKCAFQSAHFTTLVVAAQVNFIGTKWSRDLSQQTWTNTSFPAYTRFALSQDGAQLWSLDATTGVLYNETNATILFLNPGLNYTSMGIFGNPETGYFLSLTGVSTPLNATTNATTENVEFVIIGPYPFEEDQRDFFYSKEVTYLVESFPSTNAATTLLVDESSDGTIVLHTISFDLSLLKMKEHTPYVPQILPLGSILFDIYEGIKYPYAVSDDGSILVDSGDPAQTQTLVVDYPCYPDEVAFQLSTEHVLAPDEWRLTVEYNYSGFNLKSPVALCAECTLYVNTLAAKYSQTTRSICISKELRECLVLDYAPRSVRTKAFGFSAYITNRTDTTLFATYKDVHSDVNFSSFDEILEFRHPSGENKRCSYPNTITCAVGETKVAVAHDPLLDPSVDVLWAIYENGNEIFPIAPFHAVLYLDGTVTEGCVSSLVCYELKADVYGAGTDPIGRYGLFVNETLIHSADWSMGAAITFGACG